MNKIFISLIALVVVLIGSTTGYYLIAEGKSSVLDSFYMTVITIATIGYGEITYQSMSPQGRIFTLVVAFFGIAVMTYIFSNVTAFIIEGQLSQSVKRRFMNKKIAALSHHYIICGLGKEGKVIAKELLSTQREFVVIDISQETLLAAHEQLGDFLYLCGDGSDSDILIQAGCDKAKGVFAVTNDDNVNIVIGLSAKQMNVSVRVVSKTVDTKNSDKMKKAGCDATVSPSFIGGLRMASEMVRPKAVNFLDLMLRDKDKGLRIEEVPVLKEWINKSLSSVDIPHTGALILALQFSNGEWIYNPSPSYLLQEGETIIVMTNPQARRQLKETL